MRNFTIRDIERATGVKAHTLRTWEQRYNILSPERSSSNIRLYSLQEVGKLFEIAILNRNGYKISLVAQLSDAERAAKVAGLKRDDEMHEVAVLHLYMAMHKMDMVEFDILLGNFFVKWPPQVVSSEILLPFLRLTELRFRGRGKSEEHYVVTSIRRKLHWAIDNITVRSSPRVVLLFLAGVKQLDLGLLMAYLQLKACGVGVIYLGNDITQDNLEAVVKKYCPDFLYTYVGRKDLFNIPALSENLSRVAPTSSLYITLVDHELNTLSLPNVLYMPYEEAVSTLCRID